MSTSASGTAHRSGRTLRRQPVRQPPTAPIVHEQEASVPPPVRLAHRAVPSARNPPPGDQPDVASRLLHSRHPQLRAVPGHERVVPGDPGHPPPVGRRTRRGHEVPVVHQGNHRGPVGDRHRHQPVIGPTVTVTLLHAQEPLPRWGDPPSAKRVVQPEGTSESSRRRMPHRRGPSRSAAAGAVGLRGRRAPSHRSDATAGRTGRRRTAPRRGRWRCRRRTRAPGCGR